MEPHSSTQETVALHRDVNEARHTAHQIRTELLACNDTLSARIGRGAGSSNSTAQPDALNIEKQKELESKKAALEDKLDKAQDRIKHLETVIQNRPPPFLVTENARIIHEQAKMLQDIKAAHDKTQQELESSRKDVVKIRQVAELVVDQNIALVVKENQKIQSRQICPNILDMSKRVLIVDTNWIINIKGARFNEIIDLLTPTQMFLMIPFSVIQELDRKKRNQWGLKNKNSQFYDEAMHGNLIKISNWLETQTVYPRPGLFIQTSLNISSELMDRLNHLEDYDSKHHEIYQAVADISNERFKPVFLTEDMNLRTMIRASGGFAFYTLTPKAVVALQDRFDDWIGWWNPQYDEARPDWQRQR